jgi:hypothetical protein
MQACQVNGFSLPGSGWRPDGPVMYRTDPLTGELVGIIPATCKRGLHSHHKLGYRAREDADGYLIVECTFCVDAHLADGYWTLVLDGPRPVRAELDDGPYGKHEPHFVEASSRRNRASS